MFYFLPSFRWNFLLVQLQGIKGNTREGKGAKVGSIFQLLQELMEKMKCLQSTGQTLFLGRGSAKNKTKQNKNWGSIETAMGWYFFLPVSIYRQIYHWQGQTQPGINKSWHIQRCLAHLKYCTGHMERSAHSRGWWGVSVTNAPSVSFGGRGWGGHS